MAVASALCGLQAAAWALRGGRQPAGVRVMFALQGSSSCQAERHWVAGRRRRRRSPDSVCAAFPEFDSQAVLTICSGWLYRGLELAIMIRLGGRGPQAGHGVNFG